MALYKITAKNEAIIQLVTNGGATIERRWYRNGDIVDIPVADAAQLINDGEAEAYAGADPVSDYYKIRVYANPAAGSSDPFDLPTDADGFLKNDGNGVLTWVPLTAVSGNTSVVTDNGDGTYTHDDGTGNTVTIVGGGTPGTAVAPAADDATGAVGVSDDFARADHKHPAQGVSADAGNALSVGSDGLHFYEANTRLFITDTATAPATAGDPTPAEAQAAAGAARDVLVYYTGSDIANDIPSHCWLIDGTGNITEIKAPSVAVFGDADSISPAADDTVGAVGIASGEYALEDHKHPAQAVSADAEQLLKAGSDGLHMLDPDDLISADLLNALSKGGDGKLYTPEGVTLTTHNATGTNLGAVPANPPAGAKHGDFHVESHDDGLRFWKYFDQAPLPPQWVAEATFSAGIEGIDTTLAQNEVLTANRTLGLGSNDLTISGLGGAGFTTAIGGRNLIDLVSNKASFGNGAVGTDIKADELSLIVNGETFIWPDADGTAGQVLTTDGAGNLDFSDVGQLTRLFVTETSVNPATPGQPTDAEVQSVITAGGAAYRGKVVIYSGTDLTTDAITHSWISDPVNGSLTRVHEPSAAAKPFSYLAESAVNPATPGAPTDAEMHAAITAAGLTDTLVAYTGTENDFDPVTHVFAVDSTGDTQRIYEPSSASPMVGATTTTDGQGGTVPQPNAGFHQRVLIGSGQWRTNYPFSYALYRDDDQIISPGLWNNIHVVGVSYYGSGGHEFSIDAAAVSAIRPNGELRVANVGTGTVTLRETNSNTLTPLAPGQVFHGRALDAPPYFNMMEAGGTNTGDSIYTASGSLNANRIVNLSGNRIDWQGNGSGGHDERFSVRVPVDPADGGGFYDMRVDAADQAWMVRNHNAGGNTGAGGVVVGETFAAMTHNNNGISAGFQANRNGAHIQMDDLPLGLVNDTTTDYGQDGQVIVSRGNAASPEWDYPSTDCVKETVDQATHGFTIGQPIYHNGTAWAAAQADNVDTMAHGVVSEVVNAGKFVVTTHGVAEITGHGLTPGDLYWLDQSASDVSSTKPASGIAQPVLRARDANTVFVDTGASSELVGEDVRVLIGSAKPQGPASSLTTLLDALTWDQVKAQFEKVEIVWAAIEAGEKNIKVTTIDVSQIEQAAEVWFYSNSPYIFNIEIGSTSAANGPVVAAMGSFDAIEISGVYGIRGQKVVIPTTEAQVVHDQANYLDIGNKRIQWGVAPDNDAATPITLPVPFANSGYAVTFGVEALTGSVSVEGGGDVDFTYWVVENSKTTTGFSVDRDNDMNNVQLNWMAIGEKP